MNTKKHQLPEKICPICKKVYQEIRHPFYGKNSYYIHSASKHCKMLATDKNHRST